MEGPLWKLIIPCWFVYRNGRHRQFWFLIDRFLKQLFLWNCLAIWYETWKEASMEGPLLRLLISFWSINKHGFHMQFLFLIGRFLKIFFSETALTKLIEIWWEAPMEGSVLSFLKAEWNVSDTGSPQCWASNLKWRTQKSTSIMSRENFG